MRTVLENGLTLIVEEVKAAPVVALQAWVNVGSADETPTEAGLAHLHEHMLFKGTSRRGPGEIARDVESRGGEIDAWTSFDQTVYHLVLASRFLEEGLEVLSDAVLHSAFDPEELSREIEVVIEEIKRSHDIPARRASRELFSVAFEKHPYRRPVIGFEESVRSFTRDDVLGFYRRNYTPDDMVLVVAGDVEVDRVVKAVRKLWGSAEGKRGSRSSRTPEPVQTAPRAIVMKEQVQEAHLALAWHGPGVRDADLAAIDLAAGILGQGDSARLPHRVKSEKHLVSQIYAYAYTPRDPGLLVAGATLEQQHLSDAVREILREVARLAHEGPTASELSIAKHMVEAEAIWQRETVQGQARKLGFYETVGGSLDFEKRYYDAIRNTTAEEVRAACARYATRAALSIVALAPKDTAVSAEDLLTIAAEVEKEAASWPRATVEVTGPAPDLDRPAPRRSGKRRDADEAGIFHQTLPSGTRVLVKPEPAVPLVAVRAVWNGGLRHEDDSTNGIHQLVASLLSRGTTKRSAREFALEADRLAASVNGNSGRNSFGLRGDFLARRFEESMRLFTEALLSPSFDAKEVEREKSRQLQEIRARADSPSGAVFDLFAQTLYTVHPYRLDSLGEEASVSAFTAPELAAWYRARYGTSNLVVSVVGDVDPGEAFDLCEELFGARTGTGFPEGQVPVEPPLAASRSVVKRMEKQQAHLVLGFPGVRLTDKERFPLDVLSSVLAGQGGRLFTELRDKRSMAYSVTAFSMEGVDPGYFGVYMGTSPEKVEAASEGIRAELRRVVDEPVPEQELDRARRYLVGTQAIGLQKNASRAAAIAFDEAYGVGASAYTRYAHNVEVVTGKDVQEAARRTIDLDRAVLAVVTPAA